MYGYIDTKVAINNAGENLSDGQVTYKDDAWGFGWTAGILVEPMPGTRIGLSYLSKVDLDFSDTPEFDGLGPVLEGLLKRSGLTTSELDMSVTVPQMVMLSVYHEVNPKLAVMGNVGWQDWSEFGKVDIEIDNPENPKSLTIDNEYKDTWHLSLGAQYRYSSAWTFSGGIAYDSAAVDDDKRTVTLPMGESWRFALGCQYAFRPDVTLGAAYEFMWTGDMPVDQRRGPAGRLEGDYDSVSFNFFILTIAWKY